MVLTSRRWAVAWCLILVACSRSLFSNGGDTTGDGDAGDDSDRGDATVSATCPAPCIADASRDFDGTPDGSNGRWRYVEDRRDRTWTPMMADTDGFAGADPLNRISTCARRPTAAGCVDLPGALLVSAAGATAAADPAIEFTMPSAPTGTVIQLVLRVRSPANQTIRLYRNSREDVLFTGTAAANTTLDRSLVVDALPEDRFLLAVAPSGSGVADVAVQMFASESGDPFPKTCQLALRFDQAMGNTVPNPCGPAATHVDYTTSAASPPVLVAGPFPQLGMAADLPNDRLYQGGAVLQRPGDFTIQMWVQSDVVDATYGGWAFSDFDLNNGGGIGLVIYDDAGVTKGEIGTCTSPQPLMFETSAANWPADHQWHFARIAYTAGAASLCLDGRKVASFAAAPGTLQSTFVPYLGRNVIWTPAFAMFDGKIDDVRVFSFALPCE